MVSHDQTANVEIVCTDSAGCGALVAVSDLPVTGSVVLPSRAFFRVEDGVAAVFTNVCRKEGALNPSVGRTSIEVQLDRLWWCPDTNFGDVQCIVFDIFNLPGVSMTMGQGSLHVGNLYAPGLLQGDR